MISGKTAQINSIVLDLTRPRLESRSTVKSSLVSYTARQSSQVSSPSMRSHYPLDYWCDSFYLMSITKLMKAKKNLPMIIEIHIWTHIYIVQSTKLKATPVFQLMESENAIHILLYCSKIKCNGCITIIVTITCFFPHSLLSIGFVTRVNNGNNKITELRTILQRESQNSLVYKQTQSVKRQVPLQEQELLTLLGHLSSPLDFNVAQYLVFCLVYCGLLFVLLFNLRIMDSGVLFGVMKLFVVVVELKARCQILWNLYLQLLLCAFTIAMSEQRLDGANSWWYIFVVCATVFLWTVHVV